MSENNNNNSLSKEQQKKILQWLDDKWPFYKRECECCGKSDWTLNAHMTSPLTLYNGGFQLGGMAYPTVSVVCKSCANTKYFNAVVMGLVEAKQKDEGEKNGQ